MTQRRDLCVYQGETYSFDFDPLLDDVGDPIDLSSGFVAKMHIRENPLDEFILAEFTDGDGLTLGPDGVITLDILSAETSLYTWASATYDIRLIDVSEVEYSFFGMFAVTPNITREPGVFDPIITLPGTPQIITNIITDDDLVVGSVVSINTPGNVSLADADGLFEAVGVSNGIYASGSLAEILMFHGSTGKVLMDIAPSSNGVAIWLSTTPGVATETQPSGVEIVKIGILRGANGSTLTPDTIFMPHQALGGGGSVVDYLDISARDSSDSDIVYGGRGTGLTSDPVWQVYKLNTITNDQSYADGDTNFDNIWDDRESLIYP